MKTTNERVEISKTWITGNCSCTLIIPKTVAKEYGLDSPSHVIVERTPEGILIKKLEIETSERIKTSSTKSQSNPDGKHGC